MTTDEIETSRSRSRPEQAPLLGRDRLARTVVVGSFLTVFLMVSALITLAQDQVNTNAADAAQKAFNIIVPVLAGWVGTVLAYYFSSANQEHTTDILDKTIGRVTTGDAVAGVPIAQKMIPLSKIYGVRDLAQDGSRPDQIPISTLQQDFAAKLPNNAAVTRLLFVEHGVFKFIVHVSTLNAFLVKSPAAASDTFQSLLGDQDIVNQIAKLVVFVSATATLGDAKSALDRVAGAQDIIVTPTGNATETVLGWLSNVDLTKALTAS